MIKNKEHENEKYNSEVTKYVIKNRNKKYLRLNIKIDLKFIFHYNNHFRTKNNFFKNG
jgi:hypothetical protein